MSAKENERQMAVQMRSNGASVGEISERLKVSKSSVSRWVRHILLNKEQKESLAGRKEFGNALGRKKACSVNRAKYETIRSAARSQGFAEAKGEEWHVAGCMLYWAEGAKSMNSVIICNTDPVLLEKFMRFLVKLGVDTEKVKLFCRVHDTPGNASEKKCKSFWSDCLGIRDSSVRVSKVPDNTVSSKRKSRYPHGIGILKLHDVNIVQRIYGGIEKYAGKEMVFGRK